VTARPAPFDGRPAADRPP